MSLKLQNIHKSFKAPGGGTVEAVAGASLAVNPGDFCAIYGPSGSGKTTLLVMAGALLSPDGGEVSICGRNPYALGSDSRSKLRATSVGFVFQQFHLMPYLNVLENTLAPTLAGAIEGAEERARELLVRFRLAHRMQHISGALSVGEQRRVALARALMRTPPILIADEPTGNLDPENATSILSYLSEFAANGGTVLMATHDPSALQAANKRVEMREGLLSSQ